jgi:hypothetical protein
VEVYFWQEMALFTSYLETLKTFLLLLQCGDIISIEGIFYYKLIGEILESVTTPEGFAFHVLNILPVLNVLPILNHISLARPKKNRVSVKLLQKSFLIARRIQLIQGVIERFSGMLD